MARNVIDLLLEDHKKIRELFDRLEKDEKDTRALQQMIRLVTEHSKAEEQVVYPAIKKAVPEETDEVRDGAAEHHHVDGMLRKLAGMGPDDPGFDGLVAAVIGETRHHLAEEEEDVFPGFGSAADDETLAGLAERFLAAKKKVSPPA